MCGICGTVGFDNPRLVEAMNREMVHRGPDDVGLWRSDRTCLGHTRLSIIDPSSAGHQPMPNENESVWITFNGAIYNFEILKKDLERLGHRFMSKTDTEVIIHLYEEYGEECLKHMRGMFAFAIWDKEKDMLFAARDRFGIKPLFYYFKDNKFIFASELKTIIASGFISKDINIDAVRDYFTYGFVESPQTMLKGVFQLLPAHFFILKNSELKIKRYWEPYSPPNAAGSQNREEEHISDIKRILDEAVKIRMVSDVPLGAFLSGGIDSNVIVRLMQKHSRRPVKTFSIVFEENNRDKQKFSEKIIKISGTDHREILLKEKDIVKDMPLIFDSMDEPSMDGFNTFVISKAAKNAGVTVALSGLGGDELFGGYPLFKTLPAILAISKFLRFLPKNTKADIAHFLKKLMKTRRDLKLLFSFLKCENIDDLYFLKRSVFFPEETSGILKVGNQPNYGDIRDIPHAKEPDIINRLSFLEMSVYLRNMLLRDTDRMGMANSLEVRVPFLDHILVEKMFGIPGYMKIGSDYPKRLLVRSMQDILPEEIYNRPKKGFVLPFTYWLKRELRDYCEALFSRQNLKDIPIIDCAETRKIWQAFTNGSRLHNYSSILCLASFINWYRRNISIQ